MQQEEKTRIVPCIICPMGCDITVTKQGNKVVSITGNTCKRGEKYASNEVIMPSRTLTTTVKVETKNGIVPVSVRTVTPIPKTLLFDAIKEVNKITVKSPVHVGDILIKDICHTGVDVMVTDEK